ncbi:MAG TPA: VOC family protein [Bacteroidales bacterium]|nr:VOC family protein [Bacteroidales bacterium]
MQVKQILTRIYVNDMDAAIKFYEQLLNEPCASRFNYAQMNLEIARVNNILIIAGTDQALEPFRLTNATMLVDSVEAFKTFLLENGATVIRDIQQVPTGLNMTIRHKDGLTIEYVEHRK